MANAEQLANYLEKMYGISPEKVLENSNKTQKELMAEFIMINGYGTCDDVVNDCETYGYADCWATSKKVAWFTFDEFNFMVFRTFMDDVCWCYKDECPCITEEAEDSEEEAEDREEDVE